MTWKGAVGLLLWSAGHVVNALALLAAAIYVLFCVAWLHAPLPDGHQVTLFEHDMSADGSRGWRDPKDEPERINGLPARLVVLEASSGKAVSLLSWFEGRREYQLWVDANIVRVPLRGRLFALAASLPRAVPACPNEPPPPPMRFDANGHPVDEPMPQVLTQAQMDALLDGSKRPCK